MTTKVNANNLKCSSSLALATFQTLKGHTCGLMAAILDSREREISTIVEVLWTEAGVGLSSPAVFLTLQRALQLLEFKLKDSL